MVTCALIMREKEKFVVNPAQVTIQYTETIPFFNHVIIEAPSSVFKTLTFTLSLPKSYY